jgi:hypothetical protein
MTGVDVREYTTIWFSGILNFWRGRYSRNLFQDHCGDDRAAMPVDPESSEEQRLVAEYHIATERYAAAVGELGQHRTTMTKEDYTKILHMVEDARNDCERVRNSLARLHDTK